MKVKECVKEQSNCLGCEHSYRPDLFDGGCKLYYEKRRKDGKANSNTREITKSND